MKLIFGESSSGKSTEALETLKSGDKCLYISLDSDRTIKSKIDQGNFDIQYIKVEPNLMDVNIEILQRKIGTTHVIIDPINYIMKYSSISIKELVDDFSVIEDNHKIEIILVLNTLKNLETDLSNLKNIKLIKTEL